MNNTLSKIKNGYENHLCGNEMIALNVILYSFTIL
jgi:hypothetical protein